MILFVLGTRPEAIKLAPVIKAFREASVDVRVCTTGQHREMIEQMLRVFSVRVDYSLDLMKPNQSLFDITSEGLKLFGEVLGKCHTDMVIVQGDTTTALIGAMAAYYKKIPVAHVEAGLRSGDKYSPFPEEINRKLIGQIADLHFAPTRLAADNLAAEGIRNNVHIVGNTSVDALLWGIELLQAGDDPSYEEKYLLSKDQKMILVTCHRRESFGDPFQNICAALRVIAHDYPDVEIIYPVHMNPRIWNVALEELEWCMNIQLVDPVGYLEMIWLLKRSYLVLTDSGGIQEEAPVLGKPVLVMRDVTERVEGIEAGTARLVGTDETRIENEVDKLLTDQVEYEKMARAGSPYGDGKTSQRILEHVLTYMKKGEPMQ